MKLSRLEVYGFKSFAKKLDLKLTGGMTSVVGPNGCGKTNVVDAIRWVLGEQRPSMIRLDRMEDVLFKGSATRRPLGMSEVSLTIENDSGLLPLNMPEVTITRRLFRSGESDYLINKKACRLADIHDLLMDTGMGTDSYSLFELSMINAILSDKTDDRRHIFEEAAGVTKYKARRKSAMNKLSSIEDDLDRVGDIIAEMRRRVDSLKRQAAKARRYRTLKSEVKERTLAIASYELDRHKKKLDSTGRQLEQLGTSLEAARVGLSRSTADMENMNAGLLDIEKELEDVSRRFSESLRVISENEKELARLDSRLESLDEIASRSRDSSKRNAAELDRLAESHGACAEKLTSVSERLESIEARYRELNGAFGGKRENVDKLSADYSFLDREFRKIENELATGKAALGGIESKRELGRRRHEEIVERLDALDKSGTDIGKELETLADSKAERARDEHDLVKRLTDMRKSLDDAGEELAMADSRLRELYEQRSAIKAERDFLDELMSSMEGYSDGVRNAAGAEALEGRIHGVLADVISADEKYVTAVETALRDRLQTIIVEDAADAETGARFLAGGKRGRASFLPLFGGFGEAVDFDVPDAEGVVGPLWRFVRTESRFSAVVKKLFAGIVIVDSLDRAFAIAKTTPESGLCYVTLSGEMIGSWGDIHAGTAEEAGGKVIGRAEKLKELNARLRDVDSAIRDLEENREDLSERSMLMRGMIFEMENTHDRLRGELQEIAAEEARISARNDAVKDSAESLRAEAGRIEESFRLLDEEMAARQKAVNDLETSRNGVEVSLNLTFSELGEARTALETQRSEVTAVEVERAALFEKKAALNRELNAIAERRESLAQASGRSNSEIERAEEEILNVGETKQEIKICLESLEKAHAELMERKDTVERRYNDLRSSRSDLERTMQEKRREIDELSRRESSLTLERDEVRMRMDNIRERLADEFYIDPDEMPVIETGDDFDPANEKLMLEDLRRKIQMIGDVNLAAEADYDEEKERLDFLESERDDLVEAGETLKNTISKINNIARSRFVDTFGMISDNFKKMFEEFFQGGTCALELEEDVDPLEASINITARPPGKNIRSISLLSSGEKALTAISLLFAIYLVKPSPFCILDEVDAPLDDANIDRFLRVIRRFSERTQFIMVTHNKKTMAAADNLYGITMQEPGLSRLVSVRIADADPDDSAARHAEEEEAATA